jgi:regulatory protein
MKEGKSFTINEIQEKLAAYCAYQDRCQWEVENKLKEFNIIPEGKDQIIIYLIQNKFLNEERFAKSFARGKFYQKNWGKNKIKMELKKRRIPSKLIEIGLKEIDSQDYFEALEKLYKKKEESLFSERESYKKKNKIKNFLLQKGYEHHLIEEISAL